MVVFDSTVILLMLQPEAKPPIDPQTKKTLEHAKERIDFLIRTLSKNKTRILIPTPVLGEILVRAGNATGKYLDEINNNHTFQIADFDQKAAVELAQITALHLRNTGQKKMTPQETWAKLKFDWQIVAISKANGADIIYSDDSNDLRRAAAAASITVVQTWELPVAAEDRQGKLTLEPGVDSGAPEN